MRGKNTLRAMAAGLGALLLAGTIQAAPASAALGAPILTAVTPNDQGVNPILRWNAVATASKYQLKVCKDFGCAQEVVGRDTLNTAYVTDNLPIGQTYWQVRAVDGQGAAGEWARSSFNRVKANAPAITGPADNAQLVYPTEVPSFAWAPVPGAVEYILELSQDTLFNTKTQHSTRLVALSLLDTLAMNTPYYWRVFAKFADGTESQLSTTRLFRLTWDGVPNPTGPADTETVEETELTWNPIDGAAYYDVDVAANEAFTNNLRAVGTNLRTNRVTLTWTEIDGTYYWRVRSVLPNGAKGDWSDTRQAFKRSFRKEWPWPDTAASDNRRVELLAPGNNTGASPRVSTQTLSWTPVRKASYYEIQLEPTDATEAFENPITLTTNHTWITPADRFGPGSYRWRVRPIDDNIQGEWSNTTTGLNGNTNGIYPNQIPAWTFTLDYGSPANAHVIGSGGTGPIVAWDAVPGINRYRIAIYQGLNQVDVADTYNISYAPQLDSAGSYSYAIYSLDSYGRLNVTSSVSGFFNYTKPTSGTTPVSSSIPNASASVWYPAFSWTGVVAPGNVDPNSIKYNVTITSDNPADSQTIVDLKNTAYAIKANGDYPVGRFGNFTYTVVAKGNLTTPGGGTWYSAPSTTQPFIVNALQPTSLTEPCSSSTACDLEDTPTMSWQQVTGAGQYKLIVATNDNFNNPKYQWDVGSRSFTYGDSMPDSQAGDSYYWYAQPCWTSAVCGAEGQNVKPYVRAFRKRAAPVTILSPASGSAIGDQFSIRWEDYLITNQKRGPLPSPSKLPAAIKEHSQEAASYKLQIARTPDFVLDQRTYDTNATSFTVWDYSFPEGNLYYRVQAYDHSGNPLTWSSEANGANVPYVTKSVAPPTLLSPAPNEVIGSSPVLRWAATQHTLGYDIEVYKNLDPLQGLSDVNKVLTVHESNPVYALRDVLPAGTYGWRIRRYDGDNHPGSWSANTVAELRQFTYSGGKPQLTSPPDQSARSGNDLMFTWSPVSRAAKYRFQASRTADFSDVFEQVETQATSWAPTVDYGLNPVFWRVTAFGTGDTVLGVSDIWTLLRTGVGCDTTGVAPASGFYPVVPFRVYDSRSRPEGKLGANAERDIVIAGVTGSDVPANAVAVILNVTVAAPTADSYLTIFPKGTTRPNASSLNYVANQTVPNQVTAMVGNNSMITTYNYAGTTHLLVDVVGYYGPSGTGAASKFNSTPVPIRMYDSRNATKIGPGEERSLQVAGRDGIPADASAVAANITVTDPTSDSYLTVWPAGATRPNASNLNYVTGLTVPNAVTVKVGAQGKITMFNERGSTNVLVDIVGWYETGSGLLFHPLAPARILDTRSTTPLGDKEIRVSRGRAVGCVPGTGADSIVVNATVTGNTASGYLTLWPEGSTPNSSNLNWNANKTVPNAAIVRIGADGNYRVFAWAKTHVIVDVVGWFG